MGSTRLTATPVPRGPVAAVVLDDSEVAAVGKGAKRFPTAATLNGYTGRATVFGRGGERVVGLSRAVRQAAGVEAVEVLLDPAAREVEVPEVFARAHAEDPVAVANLNRLVTDPGEP